MLICCGRQAAGLRGALLMMGAGGGRWLLICCCEVWRCRCAGNGQAVQLMGCVVIWRGAGGADPSRCRRQAVRSAAAAVRWRGHRDNGGTSPSACRAADPAGRAGGQAGRRRKRKRPGRRRVVRCCSGLLSALAVRSAAPGASRCISWAVVVCSPFRCRAAGSGTDPGATVPAAPDPAARPALAVLHPVRFCPAAGGVRFSTLPGSALGVGLELSEL